MTHPIIEGMTEAVTMAKLKRENEELRHELAEERELSTDASEALEDLVLWCKNWDAQFLDDPEFDMDNYQAPIDAYRKARGL